MRYRRQGISAECFSELHAWDYDLDEVELKYFMNNNLTTKVYFRLKSLNAQVFWLSFFKNQAAVSADDFFNALSEFANINKIPHFFD